MGDDGGERLAPALGLLVGVGVDGDARLALAGGLVGAFTTFSTWMLETQRLLEEGWTRPRRSISA